MEEKKNPQTSNRGILPSPVPGTSTIGPLRIFFSNQGPKYLKIQRCGRCRTQDKREYSYQNHLGEFVQHHEFSKYRRKMPYGPKNILTWINFSWTRPSSSVASNAYILVLSFKPLTILQQLSFLFNRILDSTMHQKLIIETIEKTKLCKISLNYTSS